MANIKVSSFGLKIEASAAVRYHRVGLDFKDEAGYMVGFALLDLAEATALRDQMVVAVQRLEAHGKEKAEGETP